MYAATEKCADKGLMYSLTRQAVDVFRLVL
jgi:hypothetical protein